MGTNREQKLGATRDVNKAGTPKEQTRNKQCQATNGKSLRISLQRHATKQLLNGNKQQVRLSSYCSTTQQCNNTDTLVSNALRNNVTTQGNNLSSPRNNVTTSAISRAKTAMS
jgi:hypothetical protein